MLINIGSVDVVLAELVSALRKETEIQNKKEQREKEKELKAPRAIKAFDAEKKKTESFRVYVQQWGRCTGTKGGHLSSRASLYGRKKEKEKRKERQKYFFLSFDERMEREKKKHKQKK